jgi:ribosomal RNA-processing protein 1
MASTSASRTPPLGKYLASTGTLIFQQNKFLSSCDTSADKKTRDKAVKNLAAFLSDPDRPHISNHDMDKLWKGIFYCELI